MMVNKQRKIKNIIFDLGGVILNIDYNLTEKAFIALGFRNFDQLYSKQQQVKLFDKFETGKITAPEFRTGIKNISGVSLTDEQIDNAWCKMLIDLPQKNLDVLQHLKNKYRLFLLSNTNEIHIRGFTDIIQKQYGYMPFKEIFENIYYSNEIGLRKPGELIFRFVLKNNNLKADETLFIDDTERHLTGASQIGINTLHIPTGSDLSIVMVEFI